MDKRVILYINYIDMDNISSGSGVRPVRMYKAMIEAGHEVILVTGEQFSMQKSRRRQVGEIKEKIRNKKIDLCYIESPTYPIILHADRALIKFIHLHKIPIGYFYRDFYRKFPEEFPRRASISGRVKDFGLDLLQYLTDRILNYCDIIYVPSEEARNILEYGDVRALPPAAVNCMPLNRKRNKTGIYVGGIGGGYNIGLLIDAFSLLNKNDGCGYKLIIVCRKSEWDQFEYPHKSAKWIEVHHTSGEGLKSLYEKASFALLAKTQIPYNEFAISVKIFEYLGFGLPQIVTKAKAVSKLMDREKIGMVVDRTPEAIAFAIQQMVGDQDVYKDYQDHIQDALLNRHLWEHRVEQMIKDLEKENK